MDKVESSARDAASDNLQMRKMGYVGGGKSAKVPRVKKVRMSVTLRKGGR